MAPMQQQRTLELGYLPFERRAPVLPSGVAALRAGSVMVTSNRPVDELGEVFGNAVAATAILDRLLHHRHVLTITGESYRPREKRRTGALGAPITLPLVRD